MGVTIGGQIEIGGNILVSNAAIYTVVETFTTSTIYSVPANVDILAATALIVGGGGGGGSRTTAQASIAAGGGGGAALVRPNVDVKSLMISGSNLSITVGAGGAVDVAGGFSQFGPNAGAYYAGGGGAGGSGSGGGGGGLGSGGGIWAYTGGTLPGFPGTSQPYANNGSSNFNVYNDQHQGGSGGGAAGPGTPGSSLDPPNDNAIRLGQGGPGIWDTISGQNVYYAEGGQGAYNQGTGLVNGINGSASTTPGGGGGGGFQPGGATPGNAGVVVLRYTYTPRN